MLKEKGWSDLKLTESIQHTGRGKGWPKHQNQVKNQVRFDPDSPTACNPWHMDGMCKHEHCQTVYLRYGVIWMDLPTILLLQKQMKQVEKMDNAVCEVIKILIERIEKLESEIDDIQRRTN